MAEQTASSRQCYLPPWVSFKEMPPISPHRPTIFFEGDATDAFVERQHRLSDARDRQGAYRLMQRALDAYSSDKEKQRVAVQSFASWWNRKERIGQDDPVPSPATPATKKQKRAR